MKLFLLLNILAMTITFASDKVGNGGDIIYCPNGKSMLLDYYEGYNLPVNFVIANRENEKGFKKIVRSILERWKELDEHFVDSIASTANLMMYEIENYENLPNYRSHSVFFSSLLPDVNDEEQLLRPPANCTQEQLAVRYSNDIPMAPEFIINPDLWNKLNSFHKAGLILHEAIYKYLVSEYNHKNSIKTRSLNRIISSDFLDNITFLQYMVVLREHGIKSYKLKGHDIFVDPTSKFQYHYDKVVFYQDDMVIRVSKDGSVYSISAE